MARLERLMACCMFFSLPRLEYFGLKRVNIWAHLSDSVLCFDFIMRLKKGYWKSLELGIVALR